MYNRKITITKSIDGGIGGLVIGAVTVTIIGFIKTILDLDAQSEAQISLGLGALLVAILTAAERGIRNWLKHKNLGA